jgi:hypothetical protein
MPKPARRTRRPATRRPAPTTLPAATSTIDGFDEIVAAYRVQHFATGHAGFDKAEAAILAMLDPTTGHDADAYAAARRAFEFAITLLADTSATVPLDAKTLTGYLPRHGCTADDLARPDAAVDYTARLLVKVATYRTWKAARKARRAAAA